MCVCVYLQVREVLEGYLDDDQDMKDMNITAKEQHALQVRKSCLHKAPASALLAAVGRTWGRGLRWSCVRLDQQWRLSRYLPTGGGVIAG